MLYNFTLKNSLFVEISTVKSSDKSNYVYSGYGIACDRAGSWSFDNEFGRNVVIISY